MNLCTILSYDENVSLIMLFLVSNNEHGHDRREEFNLSALVNCATVNSSYDHAKTINFCWCICSRWWVEDKKKGVQLLVEEFNVSDCFGCHYSLSNDILSYCNFGHLLIECEKLLCGSVGFIFAIDVVSVSSCVLLLDNKCVG